MSPFFRFMTGAHQYRIEASSRDEAVRFIMEQLQPAEDTRAVILNTLYEEGEARTFTGPSNESNSES